MRQHRRRWSSVRKSASIGDGTARTWALYVPAALLPALPKVFAWGNADMGGLVISGGRVVDPASGMDAIGDVAVLDGQISAVGTGLGSAERVIDATGPRGGSRLHRPARARPVDPGRPHAGVRRGDDDARPRGGRVAGRILVSAPGRQGARAELRRRRQLGFCAHRRDDRLQRGKLAGGVRQCHARSPLDRQRGQRHRGGRHPRPPCQRTERGRHRHRHPQRLCPGRRRAGADRGVPTGGGA